MLTRILTSTTFAALSLLSSHIKVALAIVTALMDGCSQHINMMSGSILRILLQILELADLEAIISATTAFVTFCKLYIHNVGQLERDTGKLLYMVLNKYCSLAVYESGSELTRRKMRLSGLRALLAVVSSASFLAGHRSEQYLQIIYPSTISIIESMSSKKCVDQSGNSYLQSHGPKGFSIQDDLITDDELAQIAECILSQVAASANAATLRRVLDPLLAYVDKSGKWKERQLLIHCLLLLNSALNSSYHSTLLLLLMVRFEQSQNANEQHTLCLVLARILTTFGSATFGVSSLDFLRSLVNRLRALSESSDVDFQEAAIQCIGAMTVYLAYPGQLNDILLYLIAKLSSFNTGNTANHAIIQLLLRALHQAVQVRLSMSRQHYPAAPAAVVSSAAESDVFPVTNSPFELGLTIPQKSFEGYPSSNSNRISAEESSFATSTFPRVAHSLELHGLSGTAQSLNRQKRSRSQTRVSSNKAVMVQTDLPETRRAPFPIGTLVVVFKFFYDAPSEEARIDASLFVYKLLLLESTEQPAYKLGSLSLYKSQIVTKLGEVPTPSLQKTVDAPVTPIISVNDNSQYELQQLDSSQNSYNSDMNESKVVDCVLDAAHRALLAGLIETKSAATAIALCSVVSGLLQRFVWAEVAYMLPFLRTLSSILSGQVDPSWPVEQILARVENKKAPFSTLAHLLILEATYIAPLESWTSMTKHLYRELACQPGWVSSVDWLGWGLSAKGNNSDILSASNVSHISGDEMFSVDYSLTGRQELLLKLCGKGFTPSSNSIAEPNFGKYVQLAAFSPDLQQLLDKLSAQDVCQELNQPISSYETAKLTETNAIDWLFLCKDFSKTPLLSQGSGPLNPFSASLRSSSYLYNDWFVTMGISPATDDTGLEKVGEKRTTSPPTKPQAPSPKRDLYAGSVKTASLMETNRVNSYLEKDSASRLDKLRQALYTDNPFTKGNLDAVNNQGQLNQPVTRQESIALKDL